MLFILGIALIGYSLSLSPYTDEKLFMERYKGIHIGQSEDYFKLWDEMITPKYRLQDYGVTLVAAAMVVLFIAPRGGLRIKSPDSRRGLITLAVVLPFISVGGFVFDLFQAMYRREYPYWGDSIGVPLMGVPGMVVVMLIWSLVHLAFIRGNYPPATPVAGAISPKANRWLLIISAIAALFTIAGAASGLYWYAVPGVLWLYFYLSLGSIRRTIVETR